MKKKGLNLNLMLVLFVMIPLVAAILCLTIVSTSTSTKNLESQTFETLQTTSNGLKLFYEGTLASGAEVEYDHTYVDSFQNQGLELTLFLGDVRYVTSIKDDSGKRIEGTNASAAIWEAAQKGQDYQSDSVVINNKDYYVYYKPIKGADGKVAGMAFAGVLKANVVAQKNALLLKSILISLALIVVFVAICLIIARKVCNPMKKVASNISEISEGNLRSKENESSHISETNMLISASDSLLSQLGGVINGIYEKVESLQDIAEKVANASASVSDETNGVSKTMEDLATGASSLAESVQDIAAQISDMGCDIATIVENTTLLNNSAKNMNEVSKLALDNITTVAETSNESVAKVSEINRQIGLTNDAINKIDEAVEMISSIASQTNLLALNASIEAARAGEAGRGFAVVATEINNLSTQSSENASAIADIVNAVKAQSGKTVELSNAVSAAIEKEKEIVSETKDKFDDLGREINASIDAVNAIVDVIDRVNTEKDKISTAVEDLSAISEENAASNQEVSASLTTMAGSIEDISELGKSVSAESEALAQKVAFFQI